MPSIPPPITAFTLSLVSLAGLPHLHRQEESKPVRSPSVPLEMSSCEGLKRRRNQAAVGRTAIDGSARSIKRRWPSCRQGQGAPGAVRHGSIGVQHPSLIDGDTGDPDTASMRVYCSISGTRDVEYERKRFRSRRRKRLASNLIAAVLLLFGVTKIDVGTALLQHRHHHCNLRVRRSTTIARSVEGDGIITNSNIVNVNPAATQTSSTNEYSFFDEAIIYVRAGSGGQGASTYRKGVNNQNGPPDGGNGGKGGSVVLQIDESLNTLAGLARYAWRPNSFGGGGGAKRRGDGETARILSFRAENGADGKRQTKQGRGGKDITVRVPPGTVVQEEIASSTDGSEPDYLDLGTITRSNPILVVAHGGAFGEGSAAERLQRGVRRARTPPEGGERKRLKLTLKVVADVALVAVPNAGKSTLLGRVTRAKPKIADYPFTTVVPNLGVWVPSDLSAYDSDVDYDEDGDPSSSSNGKSLILCDVPGLISGASEGVGLGHAFLRHVERCHVILHLLDATSDKVLEEYAMINRELMNYGTGKLASMPQVVVVNKLDVAFDRTEDGRGGGAFGSREDLESELRSIMPHSRLMWMSAKEGDGVDDLMERVSMFVNKVKDATAAEERRRRAEAHEDP